MNDVYAVLILIFLAALLVAVIRVLHSEKRTQELIIDLTDALRARRYRSPNQPPNQDELFL